MRAYRYRRYWFGALFGIFVVSCTLEDARDEHDDDDLLAPEPSERSLAPDPLEAPAITETPPPPPVDAAVVDRRLAVVAEPSERESAVDEWAGAPEVPRTSFTDGAPSALTNGTTPKASWSETNDFHDQFGHALATGDFTGSGTTELVVSAPYDDWDSSTRNSGDMFLFTRNPGPDFSAHTQLHAGWVAGPICHNALAGWSLAVGDFNDDGFDDLAAGIPFCDSDDLDIGAVAIYAGGDDRLEFSFVVDRSWFGLGPSPGDRFGWALTVGDFNNDGVDDVAIGAPGVNGGSGAVYTMRGISGAPADFLGEMSIVLQPVSDPPRPWERFGSSLAAGDITGGAHDDLVVGAYANVVTVGPVERVSGAVFTFSGSGIGPIGGPVLSPVGPRNDDDFGRALAVGDFDNDGSEDIAVGAPGRNRSAGEVVLYRGGATIAPWATITEALVAGHVPAEGDRFGAALAAATLDSNGGADLVVGAPREKYAPYPDSGLIFAFRYSAAAWMQAGAGWRSQSGLATNETGDRFGAAIATIDEGAGLDAIVVAAPSETFNGENATRAGAVYLYSGGAAMTAWDWLSQD